MIKIYLYKLIFCKLKVVSYLSCVALIIKMLKKYFNASFKFKHESKEKVIFVELS